MCVATRNPLSARGAIARVIFGISVKNKRPCSGKRASLCGLVGCSWASGLHKDGLKAAARSRDGHFLMVIGIDAEETTLMIGSLEAPMVDTWVNGKGF